MSETEFDKIIKIPDPQPAIKGVGRHRRTIKGHASVRAAPCSQLGERGCQVYKMIHEVSSLLSDGVSVQKPYTSKTNMPIDENWMWL